MKLTGLVLIVVLLVGIGAGPLRAELRIRMGTKFTITEVARLGSVTALCEDGAGCLYVLDGKNRRVTKFAVDGKVLLTFGRRGQGPGDFHDPGGVFVNDAGEVVVDDAIGFVTVFNASGQYLRQIKMEKGIGLQYINDDVFYAWTWSANSDREQALFNRAGDPLQVFYRERFDQGAISLPDETGRRVRFNNIIEEYIPRFLFARSTKFFAVGIADRYQILLFDQRLQARGEARREAMPYPVTAAEKRAFSRRIDENRNWPDRVKKAFKERMPLEKKLFDSILLTDTHLWAVRLPADTTVESAPVPVDLFDLSGKFLGTVSLPSTPVCVSPGHLYFQAEDEDGGFILTRFPYRF